MTIYVSSTVTVKLDEYVEWFKYHKKSTAKNK